MRYNTVFVANHVTIGLIEQAVSSTERVVEVTVNGTYRGQVSLIRSYYPRVATDGDKVFIWGGARLCWSSVESGRLQSIDIVDEIHAVHVLGSDWWCIVGETSVALWHELEGVVATATYNEVLQDTWWENDQLHIRDLRGRELMVLTDLKHVTLALEPTKKVHE